MTIDEMVDYGPVQLFDLARTEDSAAIECVACGATFWVRGALIPYYDSELTEDEL